ncbi:mRNA capping enzyme [Indivirus ILV1]|uniref:mRNA capping enzyme n=1 Tax=Indivirus ILV1 TaxID=1977633 RepID=A0A1V0SDA4_9VIRU|nr:mRNA capping enzyme [Indivirus ILV1]
MSKIEDVRITGSFKDQLNATSIKNIENLYNKIDVGSEFELIFFRNERMGLENFLKMLEYLTYKSTAKKLKLVNSISLDVSYTKAKGETYRITITGIEAINRYIKMLHVRKNHVIFSVLIGLLETDQSLSIIKKTKETENILDIDDFDIRVRLSSETKISKKELDELKEINEKAMNDIVFRYKQRISIRLEDNNDFNFGIDLTNVKMSNYINRLESSSSSYELEMDLTSKKSKIDKKYLETIFNETNTMLKIIQQSNYIISRSLQTEVLSNYAKLLDVKQDNMISLAARNPQSLEVQHIVDQLPNKYAVTDKADGERYFLMTYNNYTFLISNLLTVKNTGMMLKDSKFNDSILDGELIFIKNINKYLFMAFDCLYNGGKDIRPVASFLERLSNADEIIDNCFVEKDHKKFKFDDYLGQKNVKFDANAIVKSYSEGIVEYFNALNNNLSKEKFMLVRRKFFIPALGGQNNEIFKYAQLIWDKYTKDKNVQCPYILDGTIFHPLDQKYTTSVKDSKFVEYKWKPAEKNSIDFYVQYERNKETGNIVTLYDNSREEEEQLHNKPYRVLKLFVGKFIKDIEKPILFEPEKDSVKYLAYIFLMNGEARDIEGNIIQDNTVVEFYYNNDPNIPDRHRWVPMRTRYDKTESVQRFRKKYGNYADVAYKVWRSIRNPILPNDFETLANDTLYNKHIDILRGKIDHSVIMSEAKENIYYQKITNLGKPMRNFHNYIKSILLYSYINPRYEINGKNHTVLDIGTGRGGDLMKLYYATVSLFVGIDVDLNGLISPVDGALSRYNQLKKTHPNFPKMFFVHADGRSLLNYDDQLKTLGGMSPTNQKLMNQFFSKDKSKRTQFDRISCQFAVHYFLESETTWNNFTQNVNDYLLPGGYLLLTTFDADRIIDVIGDKNQYTVYYNDEKGDRHILFDIVKKYEGIKKGDDIGLGMTIDLHNSLYSADGVYIPEYLVQKKFIQKELLERCNLELVDSDLFENQYLLNTDFFREFYKYESKAETRKFFSDVAQYYNQNEFNNACYKLTRLYRYYVFRRKDIIKEETPKKSKKTKGGVLTNQLTQEDLSFSEMPELFNPSRFIRKHPGKIIDYSFMSSVHNILINHEVIPKTVSMMQFYNDIGFDVCNDKDINKNIISKLGKKLIIKHLIDNSEGTESEAVLNGVNFIIVSKDCDNEDKPKIDKYSFNNKVPNIMLYYDGMKYWPLYETQENKIKGMFESDNDIMTKLF